MKIRFHAISPGNEPTCGDQREQASSKSFRGVEVRGKGRSSKRLYPRRSYFHMNVYLLPFDRCAFCFTWVDSQLILRQPHNTKGNRASTDRLAVVPNICYHSNKAICLLEVVY
jgi:hypothetical protein